MAEPPEGLVPEALQPRAQDLAFDLARTLASVVSLSARVPEEAFTADVLGTERAGSGVVIGDGLIVTIGYLITEADQIMLTTTEGRTVPGHALGYDFETGFGLVQALQPLDVPVLPLGVSGAAPVDTPVVLAGGGGGDRALAAQIVARQSFAGYWEYLLEEALFTAPGHPHWGGAGLIGPSGTLIGIGSLQLAAQRPGGRPEPINMVVPIDLLPPVLDDLVRFGRPQRPARPWLGLYATEADDQVVIMGLASRGPADRAQLQVADVIEAVADQPVASLEDLWRGVRALGAAGVDVPLRLVRDTDRFDITLTSADRYRFLRKPRLH